MDEIESSDGGSESFDDEYAEHSNQALERSREITESAQEIGPLPAIKDPARRESCRYNLRLYFETYLPRSIWRGWAPYQLELVNAFQSVILHGGKKARAVRRGGLKSTLARGAVLWAKSYGHRRYAVLVGATDDKSNELRDNFFDMLRTSPTLKEDFPELIPLLMKRQMPKRQFRLNGELLTVSAKDERGCIVFPVIAGADCSGSRVAPYSMNASDVSGLSFIDEDGSTIRPDLLIFDDVQTPQSAKSSVQTTARENAICTTFMGLAGLGETIAAIMVCTVREQDDLSIRMCDRKLHPDWEGKTYPVLLSEPTNKQHWIKYGDLLRQGDTPEEGFAIASAYYREHRAEMDAGAKVAWEEDKEEGYISAIQWAMTISILQPAFFRTELQQKGAAPPAGTVQLSAVEIVKRLSRIPRKVVPHHTSILTAFVDSSDHVLWWAVVAWQKDFTGFVVDYGTWPDQSRTQFYKNDLPKPLEQQLENAPWEQCFVHGHNELDRFLLDRVWKASDGSERRIDRLLKDWSDGGQMQLIANQIAVSPFRDRIRPSKAFAPKPGRKRVSDYGDKKTDLSGDGWVERLGESQKHIQYDANLFKSSLAKRLTTVVGAPSALLLPGDDENEHTLLAEHLTAEKSVKMILGEDEGVVWEHLKGRDNDWLDCLAGNIVAAASLGCLLPGEVATPKKALRTFSIPNR